MNRYNIFNLIHKALHVKLYETAIKLQQTDFTAPEEAAFAFEQIETVVDAFEQHGFHEDETVMPVIRQFNPALIRSFEEDHLEDRRQSDKLHKLRLIYENAGSPAERLQAGSAISVAFRNFMIFNIQHMQREEVELNALLWDNFSDADIKAINAHIVAAISPAEMIKFAQWFMKSINSNEAIEWLSDLKMKAPPAVFENIFALTDIYVPAAMRDYVQQEVINSGLKQTAV